MSKVITFSRVFPATHPRKGEPTHFVEKFWTSLISMGFDPEEFIDTLPIQQMRFIKDNFVRPKNGNFQPKKHTIRAGNRWKAGDYFSPRVWRGKPYNSPQIIIAPDIEIKRVVDFEIDADGCIWIDSNFCFCPEILAENDGLSEHDLNCWFSKLPFKGQIIIWDDTNLLY